MFEYFLKKVREFWIKISPKVLPFLENALSKTILILTKVWETSLPYLSRLLVVLKRVFVHVKHVVLWVKENPKKSFVILILLFSLQQGKLYWDENYVIVDPMVNTRFSNELSVFPTALDLNLYKNSSQDREFKVQTEIKAPFELKLTGKAALVVSFENGKEDFELRDSSNGFKLKVSVPQDAEVGLYSGTTTISVAGRFLLEVPVVVNVLDIKSIPDRGTVFDHERIDEGGGVLRLLHVKLKEDVQSPNERILEIASSTGSVVSGSSKYIYGDSNRYYELDFPRDIKLAEMCATIEEMEGVEVCFPEVSSVPSFSPDDKLYENLKWDESIDDNYGLVQLGLPFFWEYTTGNSKVRIGLIDNGIDPYQPDFKNRLIVKVSRPTTTAATHGTHVAGIMGAKGNNKIGVVGVVRFMHMI